MSDDTQVVKQDDQPLAGTNPFPITVQDRLGHHSSSRVKALLVAMALMSVSALVLAFVWAGQHQSTAQASGAEQTTGSQQNSSASKSSGKGKKTQATTPAGDVIDPLKDADHAIITAANGGVACAVSARGMRCDIEHREWMLRNEDRHFCDGADGIVALFASASSVAAQCPGKEASALGKPGKALAVNESHTVGSVTCKATPKGIDCDDKQGHFVQVDPETYDMS